MQSCSKGARRTYAQFFPPQYGTSFPISSPNAIRISSSSLKQSIKKQKIVQKKTKITCYKVKPDKNGTSSFLVLSGPIASAITESDRTDLIRGE